MKKTGLLDKILFGMLAALFMLLPLVYSPVSNDYFKLPKFSLFQIMSFSALALCLLNALLQKTFFSIFSRARAALILFLIYLFACFVSLFFARSMTVALKDLLPILSAFSLFTALLTLDREDLNRLVFLSLVSAALSALVGIIQHFGYDGTGLSAMSGVPASFMASTLGHRNYLAELLCMVIPFGFAFYLSASKPVSKALFLTPLCFMFFALLLTNSRSGWLAFTLSTLFFCSS